MYRTHSRGLEHHGTINVYGKLGRFLGLAEQFRSSFSLNPHKHSRVKAIRATGLQYPIAHPHLSRPGNYHVSCKSPSWPGHCPEAVLEQAQEFYAVSV